MLQYNIFLQLYNTFTKHTDTAALVSVDPEITTAKGVTVYTKLINDNVIALSFTQAQLDENHVQT